MVGARRCLALAPAVPRAIRSPDGVSPGLEIVGGRLAVPWLDGSHTIRGRASPTPTNSRRKGGHWRGTKRHFADCHGLPSPGRSGITRSGVGQALPLRIHAENAAVGAQRTRIWKHVHLSGVLAAIPGSCAKMLGRASGALPETVAPVVASGALNLTTEATETMEQKLFALLHGLRDLFGESFAASAAQVHGGLEWRSRGWEPHLSWV